MIVCGSDEGENNSSPFSPLPCQSIGHALLLALLHWFGLVWAGIYKPPNSLHTHPCPQAAIAVQDQGAVFALSRVFGSAAQELKCLQVCVYGGGG